MSPAATIDALLAEVSANPRQHLKAGELTHLRRLVAHGVATKVTNGWVLDGTFYRLATFKRLIALDLAHQTYKDGAHRLRPSPRGRAVVELLASRRNGDAAGKAGGTLSPS